MSDKRLCVFGEVLFDHLPDGARVLGGAPFNVAWHLQAFGQSPCFISRVGRDAEGAKVKTAMTAWGMRIDTLQTDDHLPTGQVSVSIEDDEPSYDIAEPVAYDAIEQAGVNAGCHLFYHGSLALRADTSRQTAEHIKAHDSDIVFVDVNLRPPWWQHDQVLDMLRGADWVKLNTDELSLLSASADGAAFMAEYRLHGLVLTHGAAGVEIITADGSHIRVQPTTDAAVVDTVGAGDAFTSVMILGLVNDWPLKITAQRAQAFASGLVGRRGATVSDRTFYQTYIDDWDIVV
ncbi:carbohydrate kinase [bacterium endosymbiont of Escarpia laminata]|nr:MAG: carbohydrate kinase [bacterium endosymbiont of Escarpia laminata]